MIDTARLTDSLLESEGLVLYAYPDSTPAKYLTIGVGRLIDQRRGGGITRDEALFLLGNDIEKARTRCERYDWYRALDPVRQNAICELMFATSPLILEGFRHMIESLTARNWARAAAELRNSLWASQVQPSRVKKLSDMLLFGEWIK